MSPEMNWSNIGIDHVKPSSSFDVSTDKQFRKAFNWTKTQPLLKQVHQHKGNKFDFFTSKLQFVKADQFLKLNEEENFQSLLQGTIYKSTWKKHRTKKLSYNHINEL